MRNVVTSPADRARERARTAALIRKEVRELEDLHPWPDALVASCDTALQIARWLERGARPGALQL